MGISSTPCQVIFLHRSYHSIYFTCVLGFLFCFFPPLWSSLVFNKLWKTVHRLSTSSSLIWTGLGRSQPGGGWRRVSCRAQVCTLPDRHPLACGTYCEIRFRNYEAFSRSEVRFWYVGREHCRPSSTRALPLEFVRSFIVETTVSASPFARCSPHRYIFTCTVLECSSRSLPSESLARLKITQRK